MKDIVSDLLTDATYYREIANPAAFDARLLTTTETPCFGRNVVLLSCSVIGRIFLVIIGKKIVWNIS